MIAQPKQAAPPEPSMPGGGHRKKRGRVYVNVSACKYESVVEAARGLGWHAYVLRRGSVARPLLSSVSSSTQSLSRGAHPPHR